MSTFRQIYEGIEKTFWNSLTKKLFSFLLLFAHQPGYLVIWQDRREAGGEGASRRVRWRRRSPSVVATFQRRPSTR